MIEKIQSLMERRQELTEAIAQPEIIQDFLRYQAYLKEHIQWLDGKIRELCGE